MRKPQLPPDKYSLYQAAVQDPVHDAFLYAKFFRLARGFEARELREDFCGTFALSCEWVKANESNSALALDLDPEPLRFGKDHAYQDLSIEERSRLRVLRKNVISTTRPSIDLIVAGNFSFFYFQERSLLLDYFRHCLASLKPRRGALILDMIGGPETIRTGTERRVIRNPSTGKFTYTWETRDFDPISNRVQYVIHFELENGKSFRNAFTYDWRLWSIREVRDLLAEAGFKSSRVVWDVAASPDREKHVLKESGANLESWIAYVVGLS